MRRLQTLLQRRLSGRRGRGSGSQLGDVLLVVLLRQYPQYPQYPYQMFPKGATTRGLKETGRERTGMTQYITQIASYLELTICRVAWSLVR